MLYRELLSNIDANCKLMIIEENPLSGTIKHHPINNDTLKMISERAGYFNGKQAWPVIDIKKHFKHSDNRVYIDNVMFYQKMI